LEPVGYLRLTAFSRNLVSMTYCGLLKLTKRGP
jgi:hypothetical protein